MKCPRCGKEFIDEWELFEHQHECAVSCFTCEHSKVASLQEPCASCKDRDKWEQGRTWKCKRKQQG